MTSELKSPVVEKAIPPEYDLGNLAVADTAPLELSADADATLHAVARDNVQLLVNQLLKLPLRRTVASADPAKSTRQSSGQVRFVMPEPLWPLPREKPLPKPKEKTRWQTFVEQKGLRRHKRERLVFDEDEQRWMPKWGYGGANKKLERQWAVEVSAKQEREGNDQIDPRKLHRQERKRLVELNKRRQKHNALRSNTI